MMKRSVLGTIYVLHIFSLFYMHGLSIQYKDSNYNPVFIHTWILQSSLVNGDQDTDIFRLKIQ